MGLDMLWINHTSCSCGQSRAGKDARCVVLWAHQQLLIMIAWRADTDTSRFDAPPLFFITVGQDTLAKSRAQLGKPDNSIFGSGHTSCMHSGLG